jgi:hypothetical protein
MSYKSETKSLLAALVAAGFKPIACDDGEPTVANLMASDQTTLSVLAPEDGRRILGLLLVYGNGPGELVCDYHVHAGLEAVVTAESRKWERLPRSEDCEDYDFADDLAGLKTEHDPDYGGAFDGNIVTSDADPGL